MHIPLEHLAAGDIQHRTEQSLVQLLDLVDLAVRAVRAAA